MRGVHDGDSRLRSFVDGLGTSRQRLSRGVEVGNASTDLSHSAVCSRRCRCCRAVLSRRRRQQDLLLVRGGDHGACSSRRSSQEGRVGSRCSSVVRRDSRG